MAADDDQRASSETAEIIADRLLLRADSKDAFLELSAKGCDPVTLGALCALLSAGAVCRLPAAVRRTKVTTRVGDEPQREVDTKGCRVVEQQLALAPMDDAETARGRFDVTFLKRQRTHFQHVARELRSIGTMMDELEATRIARATLGTGGVQAIMRRRKRPVDAAADFLDFYCEAALTTLIAAVRATSGVKPDEARLVARICRHVRERTRSYHDSLVSEVLSRLTHGSECYSASALKQWRKRHGLTSSVR